MPQDRVLHELEERFEKKRNAMLASQRGKWALFIRGIERPDFFASEQEAVDAGIWLSEGRRRFLVKQVLAEDPVLEFARVLVAE